MQKALDKSDRYIADLEQQKFRMKTNVEKEATNNFLLNDSRYSYNLGHSSLHSSPTRHICNCNKIIKTESQSLRNVKFSDKIDTIQIENEKKLNGKNLLISPTITSFGEHQQQSNILLKSSSAQQLVSKKNFICSPPIKSNSNSNTNSPFKDRLNAINSNLKSIELEIPSPLSQSQTSEKQKNISNQESLDTTIEWSLNKSKSNEKKYEDYFLEKPSFHSEDTFNNTNYNIQQNDLISKKKIPYHNSFNKNPVETCIQIKESNICHSLSNNDDENFERLLNSSTSEFKDCLKLLNMAEKKVNSIQLNRIQLSNENSRLDYNVLPEKYFKSNNNSNETLFSMTNNTMLPTNNCGSSLTTLSSSSYLSSNNNAFSPFLYEAGVSKEKNEADLHSSTKKTSRKDSGSNYKSTNFNLSNRLKKYSSLDQNLNYVQTRVNKKEQH